MTYIGLNIIYQVPIYIIKLLNDLVITTRFVKGRCRLLTESRLRTALEKLEGNDGRIFRDSFVQTINMSTL